MKTSGNAAVAAAMALGIAAGLPSAQAGPVASIGKRTAADAPGQHSMVLRVATARDLASRRVYGGVCGSLPAFPGVLTGQVGFGQAEIGWLGQACIAITLQKALMFNTAPLDSVKNKRIDGALLAFDESPAATCPLVIDTTSRTCWQDGNGNPETKPAGCVLVKIPGVSWVNDATNRGEMPIEQAAPAVNRIGAGIYDATEAFRWQSGTLPLGAKPGYGFLLQGHIPFGDLTAQDNTICISQAANIRMIVNYTVPPRGPIPLLK